MCFSLAFRQIYKLLRRPAEPAESPVFFAKASLMVMKFFRDFDILQPAIVRCPVCRKYRTQQSFW